MSKETQLKGVPHLPRSVYDYTRIYEYEFIDQTELAFKIAVNGTVSEWIPKSQCGFDNNGGLWIKHWVKNFKIKKGGK